MHCDKNILCIGETCAATAECNHSFLFNIKRGMVQLPIIMNVVVNRRPVLAPHRIHHVQVQLVRSHLVATGRSVEFKVNSSSR